MKMRMYMKSMLARKLLLSLFFVSLFWFQNVFCGTESNETEVQQQQQQQQQQLKNPNKLKQQQSECEYEKGRWEECQANGEQIKTLRLKSKPSRGKKKGSTRNCHPIKIMRRECKVGCKYARGEWSRSCGPDGLRVRIDSLVVDNNNSSTRDNQQQNNPTDGKLTPQLANNSTTSTSTNIGTCRAKRKVTKDCRRTCHYIKSDWSECINGWKTRNLTLDNDNNNISRENNHNRSKGINKLSSPALLRRALNETSTSTSSNTITTTSNNPQQQQQQQTISQTCVPHKQVKRECSLVGGPTMKVGVKKQKSTTTSYSSTPNPTMVAANQTIVGVPTTTTTTTKPKQQTLAQKRRAQKKLQRQQEKENNKLKSSTLTDGGGAGSATAAAAAASTTTSSTPTTGTFLVGR